MPLFKRRESLEFGYEPIVAAVSMLSVFDLALVLIPAVDQNAANVVSIISAVLTLLFVNDFGPGFVTAPSRSRHVIRDYGWADLLAIIPRFRIFRRFRVSEAYRSVKKLGVRYILSYLSHRRSESARFILVLTVSLPDRVLVRITTILHVVKKESRRPPRGFSV